MRRRDFVAAPLLLNAQSGPARNLVLFTSDGLRWQEVFHGIDPNLMIAKSARMAEARHLRDRFWRESPDERRKALMPELWTKLAPVATMSSEVLVTNGCKVSYPGYSEIMTGTTQDGVIRGNDPKENPAETIFEILKREWKLRREQVAVFGSWDAFQWMSEKTPGSITINAGYADIAGSPRLEELSRMQHQVMTEDTSARHDWITFEMAIEICGCANRGCCISRSTRPMSGRITTGMTGIFEMAAYVDRCLGRLWDTLQAMPEYRGSTSLVVTADHGRGDTAADWTSHGSAVAGAERIWLAAVGANRPSTAGLAKRQRDIMGMCLSIAGVRR